jgi:multiple sugar transport system substrate-binding protein
MKKNKDLPRNFVVSDRRPVSRRQFLRSAAGFTLVGLTAAAGRFPRTAAAEVGKYPYGGSGIADKAVEGARALNLKGTEVKFAWPSGIGPNFEPFFAEWEAPTGIKMKGIENPQEEHHDKVFASAVARVRDWDMIVANPRFFGDLEGAGALADLTDWVKKYGNILSGKPYGFLAPEDQYACQYRGRVYGLNADGDVYSLVYRKDLLEDPGEQAAFKEKYGHDLKVPETWEAFQEVATFFNRPPDLWGAVEQYSKGYAFWWWEQRYAATKFPNAYYFDDNMHPLVNSPEGIKATRDANALRAVMPPDIVNWNFTQVYPLFASGKAFMLTTWPAISKYANDPKTSKVVGKLGYAKVPGYRIGDKVNHRSVFSWGNTLMVWAHGKNPEAAYLFAQFVTSPEISPRMLEQPGYADPYRYSDFESPLVQRIYDPKFLPVQLENASIAVPDLMLKGAGEYSLALDKNLVDSFVGAKSPEQAMKDTAGEWEKITDRLGREEQIEAWRFLKTFYPTV